MTGISEKLYNFAWQLIPENQEAKNERSRERRISNLRAWDDEKHLKETAQWLVRAQDENGDGGVSRGYRAATVSPSHRKGWQASYPETTGYIIPTFLTLSKYFNDPSYAMRALAMADWEIEIQLASGAVMGSVVTAPPSPAVFNTGQVIFGWLAAFKYSGDEKYIQSASRAGDFLLSVQAKDGSWVKGNSKYALNSSTTYNTRVAWALIELGLQTKMEKYTVAGRQNIEFALRKQHRNGWFSDNCLDDPQRPLLHTIAYATRGILESGLRLNESQYIDAALETADALFLCQRPDGGLPGRISSDWSPEGDWDCLTGVAQVAVIWFRAHAITGKTKYRDAARNAIEFIKRTQNLTHPNPGIRGGVKGSFPFGGPYGRFELLNWAAKFFCDALMLANSYSLCETGIRG